MKKNSLLHLLIVSATLISSLSLSPAAASSPAAAPAAAMSSANVHYVRVSSYEDCSSWEAACDLQTALANATSGDEIWVAAGEHYPGGSRTVSFTLPDGVAVYGGFTGIETSRSQRDWEANPTILSGDIQMNGDPDGYALHVVTIVYAGSTTILDGFTIRDGNANAYGFNRVGGGIYLENASPNLMNLILTGNRASDGGGGMFIRYSESVLTNVVFQDNSADIGGGGIYNLNSSLTLMDVIFSNNTAGFGGGISNHSNSLTLTDVIFASNSADTFGGGMSNSFSNPTLTGVTFTGNTAGEGGGGLHNGGGNMTLTNAVFYENSAPYGGGIYNYDSSPNLTNVTFSGNTADYGGGMSNWDNSSPSLTDVTFSGNSAEYGGGMSNYASSATLTNVTFSSNTADYGGGIFNESNSHSILTNTILWGNTAPNGPQIYNDVGGSAGVAYSLVQGGYAGDNNLNDNPLLGDLADNGGATLTHALLPGSPAIDAGSPDICPPADQRGQPRPVDGNGDGQAICDIGAYEFPAHTTTTLTSHDPNPSQAGEPFTVSVVVTSITGTPTGSVTVTASGSPASCSATLTNGLGSCQLTLTEPGVYPLTATYGGAAGFAPSSDTDSHTVVAPVTTTTITGHQPDPSQAGAPFTVTFAVTSTVGTPTGNVTVTASDSPASCSASLTNGLGSCQLTLAEPGLYTLTAAYGGAAGFAPSSDSKTHTVIAAATRLYLPMVVR
jgi:hypothetical protein